MERISIFNYEAFYLDYLEGNLSEEDAALLLDFFDHHPELRLEEEMLPSFETNLPTLDQDFKAGLKQVDLVQDPITAENAETFIIAETEGLLSPDRSTELSDLLKDRKELQDLRKIYAAARLKPDLFIQYADKSGLKRKGTIVLWPYISFAVAASVAAFFFFIQPATELPIGKNNVEFAENDPTDLYGQGKDPGKVTESPQSIPNNAGTSVYQVAAVNETSSGVNKTPRSYSVSNLEKKGAAPLQLDAIDLEIIENTVAQNTYDERHQHTDYAILGINDMNNPIKPVTNRLSDAIKQEVDFRTAKTTEKNSGGFYLKIGKFELSHKKH